VKIHAIHLNNVEQRAYTLGPTQPPWAAGCYRLYQHSLFIIIWGIAGKCHPV